MFLCITENMNPNYSMIPCCVQKNPKQHSKFCYIKTWSAVFYYKYLQLFLLLSKTLYFFFSSFSLVFQNYPLLNYSKSHHHDLNNKNSKFKLTVATLTWPSVGVKPNTWKSWEFGVSRDSRMFRARLKGEKHLALGCSWFHWKGLET
jgi:hypothetical protein